MKSVVALVLFTSVAYADVDEPPPVSPPEPAPAPSTEQTAPPPAPAPAPVVEPEAVPMFSAPTTIPLGIAHRPRLAVELETFADAQSISRTGPTLNQVTLDRGEAGAAIGLGPRGGVELRIESVRSAMDGGTLGVDGDSIVFRVKRAQAYADVDLRGVWLGGALGIVADPWIAALEEDYPLRPLSPTASERLLGWPVGDLAAIGRVAYGPARLTVSVGNGEGLSFPERNDGQTTTAVVEAVPLATPAARVRVMAMARDGSVGPARVRDRRFGGAATALTHYVDAGAELVRAYGLFDRGDAQAWSVGGWAEGHVDRYAIAARGATVDFDAGGRRSTVGGAIAVEPWRQGRGCLRLWLAVDHTTTSGAAMPLPGADPGTATTVELILSATAPYVLQ